MTTWEVLDWRRKVRDLYADVRASPRPHDAHARWVAGRDRLFAEHPASPLLPAERARFAGLPVAPYHPGYRFEMRVRPADAAHLDVPTGTDGVVPFDRVGAVELPGIGTLDLWWLGTYGGGLFLPLRDGLGGAPGGTFGGGRYVLDTVKGADLGGDGELLVVDLNFAYNPSCAYDPAWACPLAPPGDTVAVDVPVGERVP